MHVVDTLARETRRNRLAFFLHLKHYRQKALDIGCWHIVAIRPLDERLAFQIEYSD